MKILAFLPDYGACGMYRVGFPMGALGDRGHDIRLWDIQQGGLPGWDICRDVQAVYLKRQWQTSVLDAVDHFPGIRPKVIMDFDDLVWRIPKWHPKQYQISGRELAGVLECASRADALTVSTPELAVEARKLNPNVYVCPNGVDFGFRDWENRARLKVLEGHLTIGWTGGDRNLKDVEVIGPALRNVMKRHRDVTLFLAGGEECVRGWLKVAGVELKRAVLHPPVNFETYPQLLTNIDIGLAPLASNEFNRCKSSIKLLEYGAWGIPYVASDVGPYRRHYRESEGRGGWTAGTPREWEQYLEDLVSDARLREVIGREGLDWVRDLHSTAKVVDCWERAFREVCGDEGQELGGAAARDSGSGVRPLVSAAE